jgi:hypothetical protein
MIACRRSFVPALARTAFAAVCLIAVALLSACADEGDDFFNSDVEPLLKARCYSCHSHADGEMNGGLALDFRSGWFTGGDHGPAVVPGKPEESLLINAVRRKGDLKMPPDEPMSEQEIATLIAWVSRGAPDPRTIDPVPSLDANAREWWSLRPLVRPNVPDAPGETPIDRFIQARLAQNGLSPLPEADRRMLIRRVTIDLHGLPPTPEETAAFLAEDQPLAYERLVDRLLASPRYGERLARFWFDAIHFADTHGTEHDVPRPNAWRYRDYVIDAFNRDLPWQTFVREQLAADAQTARTYGSLSALGFLGAGPFDYSAYSTAPVTFEYQFRDDLVTQTMSAFASSTVNCARCHNHKFDPILQDDYYALQAVFAGITPGDIVCDDDPAIAKQRQHWNQLATAATNRDAAVLLSGEIQQLTQEWVDGQGQNLAVWTPLTCESVTSSENTPFVLQDDGSYFMHSGANPEKDTYTATIGQGIAGATAIRLDVLADDRLPNKGPGRQPTNGNLHLNEVEIQWQPPDGTPAKPLKIKLAMADFDQQGWTAAHTIDGNADTAWGIHPNEGKSHFIVFTLEQPVPQDADGKLLVTLKQVHGRSHVIGRWQLQATNAEPERAVVIPPAIVEAMKLAPGDRTNDQRLSLAQFVLGRQAAEALGKLPPIPMVYGAGSEFRLIPNTGSTTVMAKPKTVHVLKRGDIGKPTAVAVAGSLTAIDDLPIRFNVSEDASERERRAALAEWLVNERNPLVWRSIVNRLWHWRFGRGLCETPGDFGRAGAEPTHPELIDYLSSQLIDYDGSLKALDRDLVLSDAYRRATPTIADRDKLKSDADNKWLARRERRRVDAETFRDALLAASGTVDLQMGGPSIQQFQIKTGIQLTPTVVYDDFDWSSAGGARRAVYRFVYRGIPDPLLEALDFPDMSGLQPTRPLSSSALQALAVMNNDFILYQSEQMAKRLDREADNMPAKVERAFLLTISRTPTPTELNEMMTLAERHGLAAVCRALFNCNEFLFVD